MEHTPTRCIQKLWACMFWMLRRTRYFSWLLVSCCFSLFSRCTHNTHLRASEAAQACSGPAMWECYKARYLCSLAPGSTDYQGCLEIKTKCNYWTRSRILDMFKYFHKVAQLAFSFFPFSFFFLPLNNFLFCLCSKLDPLCTNHRVHTRIRR